MIGIGRSGQKLCDTENGNLKPSFNVKIPGNVLEWILKIGGNDIKEQQENLECWVHAIHYFLFTIDNHFYW